MKKQPKQQQDKRGPGRPRVGGGVSVQVAVRMPAVMLEAIDALAGERLDRPDRAAMIRELVAEGLAVRKKRKG